MSQTIPEALDELDSAIRMWVRPNEVIPVLNKIGRKYKITLTEVNGSFSPAGLLDGRVHWSINALNNWTGVRRTAWNMWVFDSKKLAEKFIILYNLKWA